ncbi:hypothetical protein F3157_05395 [Virgibacillus dakarensis]|nr:hypothetical protein [Virgibacillus dakarensis]MTW85092.1 hypothetical protein [Virgibacillus dakarensis]
MEIKIEGQELIIILSALRVYRDSIRKKYGDETTEVKELTKLIEKLSKV